MGFGEIFSSVLQETYILAELQERKLLTPHSAPQRRKLLFQLQALMESLNPQMLTFSEWGLYTNYKNVFVTYVTAAK